MPGFQAHQNPDDVEIPEEVKLQPTEVLAKELLNRCHVGVVKLLKVRDGPDGQQVDVFKQWRGFSHEVLGCVEELRLEVQTIAVNGMFGGPPDDEEPPAEDWRSPGE